MKISPLLPENHARASALLRLAFPGSSYEADLVESFHRNHTKIHEWVCIHAGRVIACICFSNAYNGDEICGLHLAPIAVNPDFQGQGIGSELMHFALRQKELKERTIYVLGDPHFYQKFGFVLCKNPVCPYDTDNQHFLAIRNPVSDVFTVGYEAEFK